MPNIDCSLGNSLRRRWALYSAGGPAANLLAAFGCWAIVTAVPPPVTAGAALALGLLTGSAWVGAFTGLLNLVPVELGSGLRTDGAQIARALARSGPEAALLRIGVESARGRRPRTWGLSPGQLLEMARQDARHGDELRYHALEVAMDQADAPGAEEVHRQLMARWASLSPLLRAHIEYQHALSRVLDGDTVEGRRRLHGCAHPVAVRGGVGLLEAAIAVAEGKKQEARARMELWERTVGAAWLGSAGRVGTEWAAERIEARLRALDP